MERLFSTDGDVRIRNYSHLVENIKNYCDLNSGRVLCHFFAYLFANLDKRLFDIVNALFFTLLSFLMVKMIKGRRTNTPFLPALVFFFLINCTDMFGDDFLWLAGTVNYL